MSENPCEKNAPSQIRWKFLPKESRPCSFFCTGSFSWHFPSTFARIRKSCVKVSVAVMQFPKCRNSRYYRRKGNYTSQISSSVCWLNGSKLNRTLPLKRVGSWGIIPKRDLRSWSPIKHISTSSTVIFPSAGSTRRKSAPIKVVFPLPVLPTIPTLSPPSNVQLIPWRISGASGLYLICLEFRLWKFLVCHLSRIHVNLIVEWFTCRFTISTLPTDGQFCGGRLPLMTSEASLGISMYWLSLSTEMIWLANVHWFWIEITIAKFNPRP